MAEEHALVQLARRAVEAYVQRHEVIRPPAVLEGELARRAGVFVSLHCNDRLRGCIGTIEPVQPNVASEIIANAISAATRDPRFSPMRPDELEGLDISVDVLGEPEPIRSMAELDPKVYGVIVTCGGRRGLLLPDLEGVDSAEAQVAIALQKAWIGRSEPYKMLRFQVVRYH
ncbi:MAG: AmmeMemoRadiSam system protein A [Anaerolineae bacterium]